MVTAVEQTYLNVRHGEAGENSTFERFPDPLFNRLDEFLGNRAAVNVVFEYESAALGKRGNSNLCHTVLPAATRLLHVPALGLSILANGFAIRHLRLAHIGADTELAHHAV